MEGKKGGRKIRNLKSGNQKQGAKIQQVQEVLLQRGGITVQIHSSPFDEDEGVSMLP